uniref:Putative ovule protein n=1 Tax=Solanum chacoense TaxID=4108 RepID=A0A0V0GSX3_SOLCH
MKGLGYSYRDFLKFGWVILIQFLFRILIFFIKKIMTWPNYNWPRVKNGFTKPLLKNNGMNEPFLKR